MEFKERFLRVGAIGAVVLGTSFLTPSSSELKPSVKAEQQYLIDLGLSIDEKDFLKAAARPQFGIITQTQGAAGMDCLKSYGDFCVSEASPNFKVGINKSVADLIMKQSGLLNPSLPTEMFFTEEWLDLERVSPEESTAGYVAVSQDGINQIIVISLKAATLQAILDIENRGLSLERNFNGALSFAISYDAAHEWAHAGAQTKKLLEPGTGSIDEGLSTATHPQIFAFQQRYQNLYGVALSRGLGDGALLFVANLEDGVDLQFYKTKILQEAKDLGIVK
ncbi:MAG: hypothetical protein Q7R43_05855 [Candidatus Daviesbacteria bacterium]|nr:hypothetical protein [Candidatus Daviesbacteria bacterium]